MIKPTALAVSVAGTITTAIYLLPETEDESAAIVSETRPTFPIQICECKLAFEDFPPIPVEAFFVPFGVLFLLCWLLRK